MVKGNREKRKINTPDGLINTSGKKFVWHLYVIPMMGPTLPRFQLASKAPPRTRHDPSRDRLRHPRERRAWRKGQVPSPPLRPQGT
eukprot:scaffold7192_cov135-Isochrysis_galbana.AAC.2